MHERPKVSYRPCHCRILNRGVWAILTKQGDQHWAIVNCLDKDEACFTLDCIFTSDRGRWPYLPIAGNR